MEGLGQGQTGRRPSLGGCRGLILERNDDCKDILEVLMKCRCRKCPQNHYLNKKISLIGPSKGGGVGEGRTGRRPDLGGCRGLILDPSDDCEDSLEVLMKCRC